jgi:serine/threonine-protein kinase
MTNDPRVQQLLDELHAAPTTPEVVCGSCPELLPVVRYRWREMPCLRADLSALFPPPGDLHGAQRCVPCPGGRSWRDEATTTYQRGLAPGP